MSAVRRRLMVSAWHPKTEDREFWGRLGFRIGVGLTFKLDPPCERVKTAMVTAIIDKIGGMPK